MPHYAHGWRAVAGALKHRGFKVGKPQERIHDADLAFNVLHAEGTYHGEHMDVQLSDNGVLSMTQPCLPGYTTVGRAPPKELRAFYRGDDLCGMRSTGYFASDSCPGFLYYYWIAPGARREDVDASLPHACYSWRQRGVQQFLVSRSWLPMPWDKVVKVSVFCDDARSQQLVTMPLGSHFFLDYEHTPLVSIGACRGEFRLDIEIAEPEAAAEQAARFFLLYQRFHEEYRPWS